MTQEKDQIAEQTPPTETQNEDLSHWLSTYGLITVEKILDRYGIKLLPEDLQRTVENPDSLFFRIIQLPLKNIFNGLILQQAKDYQIYAQKLFIDYLLSGESNQEGSQVREDLEETRKGLVETAELFHEEELLHEKLISRSQVVLIEYTHQFNKRMGAAAKKIKQALQRMGLFVHDDKILVNVLSILMCAYHFNEQLPEKDEVWARVDEVFGQSFDPSFRQLLREEVGKLSEMDSETEVALQGFRIQIAELGESIKRFRSVFSSIIVKTNEMLTMVTGYQIDARQLTINQQDLYFDAKIGEDD